MTLTPPRPADLVGAASIRPKVGRLAAGDWSQEALQRTWRSLSALCLGLGVLHACVALVPALIWLLPAAWAYGKSDPRWHDALRRLTRPHSRA